MIEAIHEVDEHVFSWPRKFRLSFPGDTELNAFLGGLLRMCGNLEEKAQDEFVGFERFKAAGDYWDIRTHRITITDYHAEEKYA